MDFLCLDFFGWFMYGKMLKCFAQAHIRNWFGWNICLMTIMSASGNLMSWCFWRVFVLIHVLIAWKSHASETLLSRLKNMHLADSTRSWYVFSDKATEDLNNYDNHELRRQKCTCIWFNRNTRSKSMFFFILILGIVILYFVWSAPLSKNAVSTFQIPCKLLSFTLKDSWIRQTINGLPTKGNTYYVHITFYHNSGLTRNLTSNGCIYLCFIFVDTVF